MRTEEEILNKLCYMDKYTDIIEKHMRWYEEKSASLSKKIPTIKISRKIKKYKLKIEAGKFFLKCMNMNKSELIWCLCGVTQPQKNEI